jgi:uncharacterized membrane protein
MLRSVKLIKINSRSFRLGIAAFVLGVGFGYSITDQKITAEQIAALSAHVKNVLFVKKADPQKEG